MSQFISNSYGMYHGTIEFYKSEKDHNVNFHVLTFTSRCVKQQGVEQWFSTPVLKDHCPAHLSAVSAFSKTDLTK